MYLKILLAQCTKLNASILLAQCTKLNASISLVQCTKCIYFILDSENQCISKLDKIGIFIDMKFH